MNFQHFVLSLFAVFFTFKITGSTASVEVADASTKYFSFDYKKYFTFDYGNEYKVDKDIAEINKDLQELKIMESEKIKYGKALEAKCVLSVMRDEAKNVIEYEKNNFGLEIWDKYLLEMMKIYYDSGINIYNSVRSLILKATRYGTLINKGITNVETFINKGITNVEEKQKEFFKGFFGSQDQFLSQVKNLYLKYILDFKIVPPIFRNLLKKLNGNLVIEFEDIKKPIEDCAGFLAKSDPISEINELFKDQPKLIEKFYERANSIIGENIYKTSDIVSPTTLVPPTEKKDIKELEKNRVTTEQLALDLKEVEKPKSEDSALDDSNKELGTNLEHKEKGLGTPTIKEGVLEVEPNEIKKENNILTSENEQLTSSINNQLEKSNQEVEKLQTQISALDDSNKELGTKLEQIIAEKDKLETNFNLTTTEKNALIYNNEALKKQLEAATAGETKLLDEKTTLETELKKVRNEKDSLEAAKKADEEALKKKEEDSKKTGGNTQNDGKKGTIIIVLSVACGILFVGCLLATYLVLSKKQAI